MADVIRPSKENALVEGEKFTTAWLNIDKFPGGMMMSSHGGRFGPVPAMTGCLITTSATTVEEWRLKGMSVIEVQLRNAPETLPPRITVMDDGRAMGGSDVCHTCEAHCTVINDLQTGLQKIIREGDYTAPEGMKRIAREALGLPQDAEPWRNCQMLACKPNRRCMNSDDCNTLKASESHGPVLTRVCPGCNTVHSGPLCPTESEEVNRG